MSMILDALSRAEQERRSENGVVMDPARYVGSSSIKEERLKKWILLALLINISLVAIGLTSYLWKESQSGEAQNVVQIAPQDQLEHQPSEVLTTQAAATTTEAGAIIAQSVEPAAESVLSAAPISASAQPEGPTLSLLDEVKVSKDAKATVAKKKIAKNVAKKNPPVRYATQPLAKPANNSAATLSVPPPVPAKDYSAVNSLSPAERSQLSQYEINVHVYDNNVQNRFVLINMTKYKEGDRLPGGGPLIAAITPEGVIVDTGTGKALLERH